MQLQKPIRFLVISKHELLICEPYLEQETKYYALAALLNCWLLSIYILIIWWYVSSSSFTIMLHSQFLWLQHRESQSLLRISVVWRPHTVSGHSVDAVHWLKNVTCAMSEKCWPLFHDNFSKCIPFFVIFQCSVQKLTTEETGIKRLMSVAELPDKKLLFSCTALLQS